MGEPGNIALEQVLKSLPPTCTVVSHSYPLSALGEPTGTFEVTCKEAVASGAHAVLDSTYTIYLYTQGT